MSREEQYSVGVVIDGEDYGVWDKMEGGEVTAEDTTYRPGGMAAKVSLGGARSTANVTISRLYDLVRDHEATRSKLLPRVGRAKVVIMKQPLDVDANAFGAPLTYRGTLMRCSPPTADAQSNDPALLELEIATTGDPT